MKVILTLCAFASFLEFVNAREYGSSFYRSLQHPSGLWLQLEPPIQWSIYLFVTAQRLRTVLAIFPLPGFDMLFTAKHTREEKMLQKTWLHLPIREYIYLAIRPTCVSLKVPSRNQERRNASHPETKTKIILHNAQKLFRLMGLDNRLPLHLTHFLQRRQL